MDHPMYEHAKAQVLQQVKEAMKLSNQTESFWENLQAFAHAVDWKEQWIIGLLAAHVLVFLLVVLFRRNTTFLGMIFFSLGAIVYFGERINGLAAQHWTEFAQQNYFDSNGVFYSVMVSAPAVFNLFAVLIFYLLEVTNLMVVVKKKELIHKAKARAKAGATAGAGSKKQQ